MSPPEPTTPQAVNRAFLRLTVVGLGFIGLVAALGALAYVLPTWIAFTAMGVVGLAGAIVGTRALGWPMIWAVIVAAIFGFGTSSQGSVSRQIHAAQRLGPVSLARVAELSLQEAFLFEDVAFGTLTHAYTWCVEGDCDDMLLVSMLPVGAGPEAPIADWVQIYATEEFEDTAVFGRALMASHEPSELAAFCAGAGRACADAPRLFSAFDPARAEEGISVPIMLVLLVLTWFIPLLIGWRSTLGQGHVVASEQG